MPIDQSLFDALRAMPVFKPEMRQANRDGRKSQTRRVIDLRELRQVTTEGILNSSFFFRNKRGTWQNCSHDELLKKCSYGKAGDFVYMREPLVRGFGDVAYYKDDEVMVRHALTGEPITWRWKNDVLTSIFMPKEAARSFYRYEFIRVERVLDISEEDAKAEGVFDICPDGVEDCRFWSHRNSYEILFNRINANRGYPWKSNPWVWVLGYSPCDPLRRDAPPPPFSEEQERQMEEEGQSHE